MSNNPPSRPALRKSVDAALHPALAGRTVHPAPALRQAPPGKSASGKALSKADPRTEQSRSAAKPGSAAPGFAGGKRKRAATSDVLRPTKQDPAVKVTLTVPKSLRRKLRAEAKLQNLEPEQLAARLIAEGLR